MLCVVCCVSYVMCSLSLSLSVMCGALYVSSMYVWCVLRVCGVSCAVRCVLVCCMCACVRRVACCGVCVSAFVSSHGAAAHPKEFVSMSSGR